MAPAARALPDALARRLCAGPAWRPSVQAERAGRLPGRAGRPAERTDRAGRPSEQAGLHAKRAGRASVWPERAVSPLC